MTTFELGQTVTASVQITSDGTTAADLGGGNATCLATKPDGTTVAATVTKPGTGLYLGATPGALAGRYRLTFSGTGANSGALPYTAICDVWPSDPRLIISLEDAKAELNVPAGVTVKDDELRLYIAATTPVVEEIVGRVLTATLVETFDGGLECVKLSERAASITSVTVNGVATTNYVANLASGIVWAGTTSGADTFAWGRQNVVVTYVAGSSTVEPNVILGARIIVAQQWQVGQQGRAGRGRAASAEDMTQLASGYAVPTRAVEWLSPSMSRRMPGFA